MIQITPTHPAFPSLEPVLRSTLAALPSVDYTMSWVLEQLKTKKLFCLVTLHEGKVQDFVLVERQVVPTGAVVAFLLLTSATGPVILEEEPQLADFCRMIGAVRIEAWCTPETAKVLRDACAYTPTAVVMEKHCG